MTKCEHDPEKPGYIFFDDWCMRKIKEGFVQVQCENCKLWYWEKKGKPEKALGREDE